MSDRDHCGGGDKRKKRHTRKNVKERIKRERERELMFMGVDAQYN